MNIKVICNTRALNSPVTGIQRYMLEILSRLPADEVRSVAPPTWVKRPFNLLWEQCILPSRLPRQVPLWSPCNTGPLLVDRQVVTVHDLSIVDFPQDFSVMYRRYYEFLFPRLLPRVASVITVSEYSRRRLLETYRLPAAHVHAIPLGVDHARFKPQSEEVIEEVRARLRLPKRYVLYLGTLSARKNVAQLIRAWGRIQHAVSDEIHLVLAGGAGASHVFSDSELPPFPPRTLTTGRIAEGDLAPLLSGADVFVFPSLYEGFGLPPLEAMACGAPCITSNVTSLPEVIGDAGILMDPRDDDSLAGALRQLLNDPKMAALLRRKGLARAALFSWDTAARDTWKVLMGAR